MNTQLIDQPRDDQARDTGHERFFGRFTVSQKRGTLDLPDEGTPITLEENGRGARITIGNPLDSECRILTGSCDAKTGCLTGSYNESYKFEFSLQTSSLPSARDGREDTGFQRRRLTCAISMKGVGSPASSSWDADEDGPG